MLARFGQQFQQFLLRGGVFEFMVAFAIAGAFATLIRDFVRYMLTPLIAAALGQSDFGALTFQVNSSVFRYGELLNSMIAFALIVLAVYLVVVGANAMSAWSNRSEPLDPTMRSCPECLSDIPRRARRCAFCTSDVTPQSAARRRGPAGA